MLRIQGLRVLGFRETRVQRFSGVEAWGFGWASGIGFRV